MEIWRGWGVKCLKSLGITLLLDIVLGTRPEIIKLAPVIKELSNQDGLGVSVTLTGQHPDLINEFLEWFDIKSNQNLEVADNSFNIFDMSSNIFTRYSHYLKSSKISGVVVQGDTSSGLFSALAAFYCKLPIFHIEAGLRSHVADSPFPEEMNRRLLSQLSNLHFCPTVLNKENLLSEGVKNKSIFVSGNTVVDSLMWTLNKINKLNFISEFMPKNPYCLITLHRRESWEKHLHDIVLGIKESALKNPDFNYLFVMHVNPLLQKIIYTHLDELNNINLISPLNYKNMIFLINNC